MDKKSVDKSHMAYENKGMKAPRPEAYGKPSPSEPPKNKPSMNKHPEQAEYKYPEHNEQSQKLEHKKKALPGVQGMPDLRGANEGEKMDVNEHYHNPLKDNE